MKTINKISELRGNHHKVAEVLVAEGEKSNDKEGWVNTLTIARKVDTANANVSSTLNQLRNRGLVESRKPDGSKVHEWRLTDTVKVIPEKPIRRRKNKPSKSPKIPKNLNAAEQLQWHASAIAELAEQLADDLALVELIRDRK